MSYPNTPRDPAHADMPAVSPLDVPVSADVQQPQQARRRISPKSPRQALQPEAAPPPPPRSQKAKHPLVVALNFVLMIVVLGVLAIGGAFYFGNAALTRPGPLTEQTPVLVAPGADLGTIASQLQRQNVIDGALIFTTAARLRRVEDRLKAGEYLFQPGISMDEVLDNLVTGSSVLHAITLPEGLTSEKIVERLRADVTLTGDIAAIPAEGSLMPDTYKFTRGATRQQMLDEMRQAQARIVAAAWARRSPDLPVETPEEFVTLASIVEKETGRADERPRVAAAFINRLRAGMRLQSDPTVIYGIFGGAGKPSDRPIFRSDLDKATPYNTYQIAGLPPAPIANPGRAALEAVANPSRTTELYFVADGTGGHAFATTLDDHNQNVARWREIEAERKRVAAEAGEEEPAAAEGTEELGADMPAAEESGEEPSGEEPAAGEAQAEEAAEP